MVILYVDNRACDLDAMPAIPINFSTARLTSPKSQRLGREMELSLPSTPANDTIFGAAQDLHNARRFNSRHHTARIEVDLTTMFNGTLHLRDITTESSGERRYHVHIVEGGERWAKEAALRGIGDTGGGFSLPFTLETVRNSWKGDDAIVRFLPVHRDQRALVSSSTLQQIERLPMIDDYHPFFSVHQLVAEMFGQYGYAVHGNFMHDPLYTSLYISGKYPSSDTTHLRARLDFLARRKGAATATADSLGRVYASPSVVLHSVGNIVDTANPATIDEEGELMTDTFSTNDSFTIDENGYARFRTPTAATVGFLLHLEYETDYRIATRDRLKGFDTIEALPASRLEFHIANHFIDRREEMVGGISYNVIIFNFVEGATYTLTVKDSSGKTLKTTALTSRSTIVSIPAGEGLRCSLGAGVIGQSEVGESDWAMYDGYVKERGKSSIVVDLRIPSLDFKAGEGFAFNKIWFGGAEPDMALTLSKHCSLRPVFSLLPGYGTNVTLYDIANYPASQLDLMEALCQMFHLGIVAHDEDMVRIEPLEHFYTDTIYDWSDRVDYSSPITIADAGIREAQYQRLKYRSGDIASERYNKEHDTELGCWTTEIPLYGTLDTTKTHENPLFTTAVNTTSAFESAPSASVISMPDYDSSPNTPHIVRYMGFCPLPEGERWSYPLNEGRYPLAAFHFAGNEQKAPFTLCFEDRDGARGLNHYHESRFESLRNQQVVSLQLRLTPTDIEQLFIFDGVTPSIFDTFRFTLNGESALYRLDAIEEFTPGQPSTRCRFTRLDRD